MESCSCTYDKNDLSYKNGVTSYKYLDCNAVPGPEESAHK